MKKSIITFLLTAGSIFSAVASVSVTIQDKEFQADTLRHIKVGPGTTYTEFKFTSSSKKFTVHALNMEMKGHDNVEFRMEIGKDSTLTTELISSIAKRKSDSDTHYFAAINADFFITSGYDPNYVGEPHMDCIMNGEIASSGYLNAADYGHFFIDKNKYMWCDNPTQTFQITYPDGSTVTMPRINHDIFDNETVLFNSKYGKQTRVSGCTEVQVKLAEGESWGINRPIKLIVTSTPSSTGFTPINKDGAVLSAKGSGAEKIASLKPGDELVANFTISMQDYGVSPDIKECSGGDVVILKKGAVVYDAHRFINGRDSNNPRTMFGYNEDRSNMTWCLVDGRSSVSDGCTYTEGADLMHFLGCYDAVNVDGGGSSGMYIEALGIVNKPSDGNERPVANGMFAVLNAPEDSEIAEIRFMDHVMTLPKYGYYTPVIYGYNKYGVLISTDVKGYTLSCPDALGVPTNEGATLFSNGSGCHVLTADYNGIKAQLVVTVGEGEPKFRLDNVLLDSFKDYAVEVTATVNGAEMAIDNSALTWSSDNPEIATVDNVGNIQGIKNGTTIIRGNIADIKDSIIVTVEVPTVRYQALDITADLAAWKITKSGIDSIGISANENKALLIDYVMGSARAPKIRIANSVTAWSRPDSIYINFKPNNANISYLQIGVVAKTGRTTWLKFEPQIINNSANRLAIPMGELIDVTDMGAYPFVLGGLDFYISDEKGAKCQIEISSIEGVYTNIDPDAGSVENLIADIKDDKLLITPNPVNAGETIAINTDENTVFTIYSVTGRVAKNGIGNVIDTDGLNSGIYIVNVNSDNIIKSAKLVIK